MTDHTNPECTEALADCPWHYSPQRAEESAALAESGQAASNDIGAVGHVDASVELVARDALFVGERASVAPAAPSSREVVRCLSFLVDPHGVDRLSQPLAMGLATALLLRLRGGLDTTRVSRTLAPHPFAGRMNQLGASLLQCMTFLAGTADLELQRHQNASLVSVGPSLCLTAVARVS